MRPPMNMTPEETEIWQRMEQYGEELVRDMGAALLQADRLPEWMKETAVNMLCDKLTDARALAASWMNDRGEPRKGNEEDLGRIPCPDGRRAEKAGLAAPGRQGKQCIPAFERSEPGQTAEHTGLDRTV